MKFLSVEAIYKENYIFPLWIDIAFNTERLSVKFLDLIKSMVSLIHTCKSRVNNIETCHVSIVVVVKTMNSNKTI